MYVGVRLRVRVGCVWEWVCAWVCGYVFVGVCAGVCLWMSAWCVGARVGARACRYVGVGAAFWKNSDFEKNEFLVFSFEQKLKIFK